MRRIFMAMNSEDPAMIMKPIRSMRPIQRREFLARQSIEGPTRRRQDLLILLEGGHQRTERFSAARSKR
jgi:hypothetical protein